MTNVIRLGQRLGERAAERDHDDDENRVHAELLYYVALRLQCSAFRALLLLGHIDGAAPCRADRLAEFHQQVSDDVCLAECLMEVFGGAGETETVER